MDFQFTEEQDMLRNFARSFMEDKITKEHVREMETNDLGFSEDLWKEMAEMGWMGLVFPEEYGGQGMGFFELTVLLEEMGRACCPGPFFSTVLCGMSIMDAGTEDQKKEYLAKIGDGSMKMALALLEPAGTLSAEGIATTATADGSDYVLNGTKLFVADANAADHLLVAAKTGSGVTMFIVDAGSAGIGTTMLTTIASDKQAEIVLENVKVSGANVLGTVDKGWEVAQKIIQRGAIGKCAEIIGGAQLVLEMTIEYSKERVQFGKPVGSFQAVQHHAANMATDIDGSKFITYEAAWLMGEGEQCAKEISMAKAWCSDAYQRVLTTAHQVHGAIGFTMDHDLQLYFRRGKAAELAFGDADYHRELIAQAIVV